jgi:hypothetical protein
MSFKRQRFTRGTHPEAPPAHVEYLLDGDYDGNDEKFFFSVDDAAVRAAWAALRDDLLRDWIRECPGTRPWAWWKHDAPKAKAPEIPKWHLSEMVEPRRRIGGAGAPSWEKYPAILPYYTCGIPDSWEGIDKADPPTFESEASYLDRHGLLSETERKVLPPDAFEPEAIR